MERVFIDRDYAIAYVVMAIDSIWNSANKERTMEDFIEEIKTMTEVHADENNLLKLMEEKLSQKRSYKIKITKEKNIKRKLQNV